MMGERVFATGSVRDSREGKGRYDLLSPFALKAIALRMELGVERYGERNWEKGQPLSVYYDSAMRHQMCMMLGYDDEDHAGAALWNWHCFVHTREAIKNGLLPAELDDLPKYTKARGTMNGKAKRTKKRANPSKRRRAKTRMS